jgi:hypothetical protein
LDDPDAFGVGFGAPTTFEGFPEALFDRRFLKVSLESCGEHEAFERFGAVAGATGVLVGEKGDNLFLLFVKVFFEKVGKKGPAENNSFVLERVSVGGKFLPRSDGDHGLHHEP